MKYLDAKFSSRPASDAYRDGWDRTFRRAAALRELPKPTTDNWPLSIPGKRRESPRPVAFGPNGKVTFSAGITTAQFIEIRPSDEVHFLGDSVTSPGSPVVNATVAEHKPKKRRKR